MTNNIENDTLTNLITDLTTQLRGISKTQWLIFQCLEYELSQLEGEKK